jgi:hypothetical protein
MTEAEYLLIEKSLMSLSAPQLREALREVIYTLWPRDGAPREWNADTLERLAQLLHRRGLNPDA